MKSLFLVTLLFLILYFKVFSQGWIQTGSSPQGSGVTDMLVKQSTGFIYVTTGSAPSEPGGVRVSTDGGDTWLNQTTSYIARTITEGEDGNLYASIWPDTNFFSSEGLYRSTNNGAVWTPLGFVQPGDNIFSIAVQDSPHTIFAGTRNGIIRSKNNGQTFEYSNSGIPDSSWVRDLKIAPDGIVISATTNGVFFSKDNGDTWLGTEGLQSGDTAVSIAVLSSSSELITNKIINGAQDEFDKFIVGTAAGKILQGVIEESVIKFQIIYSYTGGNAEVADLAAVKNLTTGIEHIYSVFFKNPIEKGGIGHISNSDFVEFLNENLPPGLSKICLLFSHPSAKNLSMKTDKVDYTLYSGTFLNKAGGARIYKLTQTTRIKEISLQIPDKFILFQNFPNPFNPSTKIQFTIPNDSFTRLEIFNITGEIIATLLSENLKTGTYEFEWNAEKYSSGVYFYRLSTNRLQQTKKLLLLR